MTPSHFVIEGWDSRSSAELLSKHIVMTAAKQKTIAMKSPLLIGFLRNIKAARLIRKGFVWKITVYK